MGTQPELHVASNIYTGSFPRFERPKIIGFIGLENIKYARRIQEGKVRFDLNLHYDKAVHKPEDLDVKLTDLLKFLLQNEARLSFPLESSLDKAQFFCYRGLMTCVACTPYENKEPWKIVAVLLRGNIYLCAHKPNVEPNPDEPVDENEEFSLVFTTHLKNHRIVYGAEMDGICCNRQEVSEPPSKDQGVESIVDYLSTKEFVELKTNRHIQHPNQERSFRRFKTKKWWCQSFLVGVDSILCGLRNDDGIVEQLKIFSKFWNPNICFNFLENFFSHVKRCLARKIRRIHGEQALNNLQTLPMINIMFEWTPGMPVVVNENY
ncbi:Protein Dom3Z, partial [Operophtera brumata]